MVVKLENKTEHRKIHKISEPAREREREREWQVIIEAVFVINFVAILLQIVI